MTMFYSKVYTTNLMWTKEKQNQYNKKYRLENKEKIKQIQDDYYQKNREKRIENARDWYRKNHSRVLEVRRANMRTPKGRLRSIKASAKTRKIVYLLEDADAIDIMKNPCLYCGDDVPVGIDRIDSSLGYLKDNCVPCCTVCNYMKKDFKQSQFIDQCKKIALNIKLY